MNAAATYEEWSDPLIGLEYARSGNLITYRPDATFYVDGIRYDSQCGPGPAYRRTMLQFLTDDRDVRYSATFTSPPPTDAELDRYVRTGRLCGRQV